MDIENKMLVDAYWESFDEDLWKKQDEIEREIGDDQYDDEAAYIAEYGWGRANGYCL